MISVIVLNWNGKKHLETCITSLYDQNFTEFEVILVDNGSTDDSVSFIQDSFPDVKIISLKKNHGFCVGNNIGISATKGDFIALLNNDTMVQKDWLKALHQAACKYPEAGFFASKMCLFDQPNVIDAAGDEFCTAGFASKRGWLEPDGKRFNSAENVFGACGGAALYRRKMLQEIGLLDEDFFANGEDVDLSFRAHIFGYNCRFVPDAVVYHKGGATIGKSDKWFYLMRRNQIWILIKNMPSRLLIKYFPEILAYNISSFIFHCLKGRGLLIRKAYGDALMKTFKMLKKRRLIQSNRKAEIRDIDASLKKGCLFKRARSPVTEKLSRSYKLDKRGSSEF